MSSAKLAACEAEYRRRQGGEPDAPDVDPGRYDWDHNARPDQLLPPDPWLYWVCLAGRGWGKTRVGAEAVREWVKRYRYVNLIGATADDARDIMIEGESGILACCPDGERPRYVGRQLRWPNGAKSLIFTADEPERMRGKQHMKIWGDEFCLIAGTMIRSEAGETPIERVAAGELVWTRGGLRPVVRAWMTTDRGEVYEVRTSDGRTLIGTASHPVWTRETGFTPLKSLYPGVTLETWEQNRSWSGGISVGTSIPTTTGIERANCSTASFTPTPTGRSRRGTTSTTSTTTSRTTTSPTSGRCRRLSIAPSTNPGVSSPGTPSDVRSVPGSGGRRNLRRIESASSAGRLTARPDSGRSSAAQTAGAPTIGPGTPVLASPGHPDRPGYASSAGPRSSRPTPGPSAAPASAGYDTGPRVVSVRRLPIRVPVFNIEVEGDHEYYANGILTHNCAWRYPDAWTQAQLGLRLGDNPQAILTTTPRPSESLRQLLADPGTIVTRGRTHDNRDNLSPAFLAKVVRKYEGTRLGRQEIEAEILSDIPGALWQQDAIDANRLPVFPAGLRLAALAIGVDPSGKNFDPTDPGQEDDPGSECGIVAAGIGEDGHGYVFQDASLSASPGGWARVVSECYHAWGAGVIVAERNFGGAMVEHTIRSVDPSANIKMVNASVGKRARAEPISALYERGLVHHVGPARDYARLEAQMTTFVPGEPSPDRMDALVWALTELMGAEVAAPPQVGGRRAGWDFAWR